MGKEKITKYVTSSFCIFGAITLMTGIVGYNGYIIELRINHAREYCPLCGVFGLEHQVRQVNKMQKYYAVYKDDFLGERVEIFDKEILKEERKCVLVKTIRR